MSCEVFLVRHGEADESLGSDPSLTDRGRAQAAAVGERLSGVRSDALLHSSKRRAVDTANAIAGFIEDCPVRHSVHADDRTPAPRERSGAPAALVSYLPTVPADELDLDGARLDEAVAHFASLGLGTEQRRILVVTHGFVIGWFVQRATDADEFAWTRLGAANASLTIVRFDDAGSPRLVSFNDTGHLVDL